MIAFDTGDTRDSNKPFSGRAIIPIYDDKHEFIVGFTGRSLYPECPHCLYHHPVSASECPAGYENWTKWRHHPKGLPRESLLFGWWKAKTLIEETSEVYLFESPGDTMRAYEAGCLNGVGLFGSSLSDRQQIMLECAGVLTVHLCLNDDEAGKSGAELIKKKLARTCKVVVHPLPHGVNDLGDMTRDEARKILT